MRHFLIFMVLMGGWGGGTRAQVRKLLEVARFGHYQPIALAVTKNARIFVGFPHNQVYQYGVVELKNGKQQPYPNLEWNRYDEADPAHHFISVQAIWPDEKDQLWVLDPASPMTAEKKMLGCKLIKIDSKSGRIKRVYHFPDLPLDKSALNDVRIDIRRNLAYFSDPGLSALVIMNLSTGKTRVVLKDDASTRVSLGFRLHLDGKAVVNQNGRPFSSAVNGISLSADGHYFYYRAINQTRLYRIATRYLADASLTDTELSTHVENLGETGISHGMISDNQGNVYLSDSPDQAIRYWTAAGKLETLIKDPRLIWPDTFSIGPDGFLYVTCSQINRRPDYNEGVDKTDYPFRLYKVKLP